MSYDGGHPVNEIEVFGTDGDSVAVWCDDDLRRRLAAGDMLAALELCVDCLADLARLDDGTSSISALNQARTAIAKAKGEPASRTDRRHRLPPDPEKMNDERAEWAGAALRHFQCTTGADYEDALGDLLGASSRFDFRKRVAYDPEAKRLFHTHARRQLLALAAALGLGDGHYDLRSNEAGIAVSGEIILHADCLYIQVSQPSLGADSGILFRSCDGRRDHVGGVNNFASLDLLHCPAELARPIRRAGLA